MAPNFDFSTTHS